MNEATETRLPHMLVGGMPVACAGHKDLTSAMIEDVQRRRSGSLMHTLTVFSSNAHAISLYEADEEFARAIDSADIIHADGQFSVWASKLSHGKSGVPERTATTDFFHTAAAAAASNEVSFYLLGGNEEVNRACAEKMAKLYPGLSVAGRRNGYFDLTQENAIIDDINNSGADILWVGLGKPKEQFFSIRAAPKLKHCSWIVTCGGCFHYVVGDYSRAPLWMQKFGLEWLHRVSTGPSYLLKRYLKSLPHAISIVLKKDLRKGIFRK